LRQYAQLVLEISYVDPNTTNERITADQTPPLIRSVTVAPANTSNQFGPAAQGFRVSAIVIDRDSGIDSVTGVYTLDGRNWQSVTLKPGQDGVFEAFIAAPSTQRSPSVYITARDNSGNVATETGKGTLQAVGRNYLPLVRR
jgi:hypothetical protein